MEDGNDYGEVFFKNEKKTDPGNPHEDFQHEDSRDYMDTQVLG